MNFQKLSTFLALGLLVLYQVGVPHAAPMSSTLEKPPTVPRTEERGDLLLTLLMKRFLQRMIPEAVQETEGSRIATQKRACNTGTCLTHKLAGLLSQTGSVAHTNLLPPDMVPKNSGKKGRDLDA